MSHSEGRKFQEKDYSEKRSRKVQVVVLTSVLGVDTHHMMTSVVQQVEGHVPSATERVTSPACVGLQVVAIKFMK